MQEINDSLTSAKLMRDNYTNGTDIFKNQKHKFELASQKFDIGAMSRLDYLKHEKEMLQVEEEEISSKIDYVVSTINLYKAVGGIDYLSQPVDTEKEDV